MVVDLGTGDGRAVLARAAAEPRSLVLGLDASPAAMAEASRRAERSRIPNALFVVAAAERVPSELHGVAAAVTIHFPWGSLLRGTLALDPAAAHGIAALLAPGAGATALVSITERDGLGLAPLTADDAPRLAERWACHGLDLVALRPATDAEVAESGSSWARRLRGGSRDRPVRRIELRRGGDDPVS